MPDRAQVTSIEALDSFRAELLVYLSKMRPLLEDSSDEISRTRLWLQSDRRLHWESQVRRRTKELEQAQQALFSAELANLRGPAMAERMAVQRRERALADAQDKLRLVKKWTIEFDHRAEPLAKQLESLHSVLTQTVPRAAAWLAQAVKTLDAYARVAGPKTVSPTQPPRKDLTNASQDQPGVTSSEANLPSGGPKEIL
jgi:hypothetical protein